MFRRRRRDGKDEREPAQAGYSAVEDETADEYYPDDEYEAGDEQDEFGGQEYDELGGEQYDEFGDDQFEETEAVTAEQESARRPSRDDLGDPDTWTRLRDSQTVRPAMARSAGPWDSGSEYPEGPRMDFGSLLVPVREGYDLLVMQSEEEGVSIVVVRGDSGLQLLPFAAPRSSGLWHDVLPEIADEVAKAGGHSREMSGPFGPELLATITPQAEGNIQVPPQTLRFMGADGPRWFLRGLINGPAATDEELARPLEEIFADVVVVRGEQAQPPRQPLQIALPQEAQEAFEQQAAQESGLPNPFERGPEITETR